MAFGAGKGAGDPAPRAQAVGPARTPRVARLSAGSRGPTMDSTFIDRDVALRDGRAVHLRAMQPSDEAELLQAFERMDADARYMRFMRVVREPNLERVRKALASFPAGGLGIVATAPAADGVDIVGSAIFLVAATRRAANSRSTSPPTYGGAGLGGTLMNALIGAARRRGLADMEGFVLAANKPMLRLAARPRIQRRARPGRPDRSPLPPAPRGYLMPAHGHGRAVADRQPVGRVPRRGNVDARRALRRRDAVVD